MPKMQRKLPNHVPRSKYAHELFLPSLASIVRQASIAHHTTSSGFVDDFETLFRCLAAFVGGLDVPGICAEGVATAADAHFCEVAQGVLCFCEAWAIR